MVRSTTLDRRTYLKTVGAVGTVGVSSFVAGCIGDTEAIVPATASGFPPFEFYENGDLVGFDIDLAEATIEEAGYEVGTWVDIEFDTLIPALREGEFDLLAAAMTITDARAEQIAFSDPYWEADQAVLVRTDAGFHPESFADLESRSVAAQAGTTGESLIQEQLIDTGLISEADYRGLDNYTLAVSDLEAGAVDAVVIDSPVAATFAADRQVEIAFIFETGEEFGFGMRLDDERLGDINDGLAALMADSTYDEIVIEWFE